MLTFDFCIYFTENQQYTFLSMDEHCHNELQVLTWTYISHYHIGWNDPFMERGVVNLRKRFLDDVTLELCLKKVGFAKNKHIVRGRKNRGKKSKNFYIIK